jgi:hypothetical protein
MFLDPMAYPDPKGEGDQSMPWKPAVMSKDQEWRAGGSA